MSNQIQGALAAFRRLAASFSRSSFLAYFLANRHRRGQPGVAHRTERLALTLLGNQFGVSARRADDEPPFADAKACRFLDIDGLDSRILGDERLAAIIAAHLAVEEFE